MIAEFRHQLRRYRGQILGWGIGFALFSLLMVAFYDSVVAMGDKLTQVMESLPPQLQALMGGSLDSIATPAGYLSTKYLALLPVLGGIFAVLAGSGMIADDEERGTLDLIAAHPISRTALFSARFMALTLAIALILTLLWLGLVGAARAFAFPATALQMSLPILSLFGFLLLFAALALLLAELLPSRRIAASLAGALLVLSYFLSSMGEVTDRVDWATPFSPYSYFQSGDAMNGLNVAWLSGLIGVALLCALMAWQRFLRRDIRVMGEGSWPGQSPPKQGQTRGKIAAPLILRPATGKDG
ncbi:MAG: ABC transporter permease subunit [Anaerolineales bacterium]|nr:ABC transporter permease subunit [Anaerolineales bacterium]